MTSRALAFLGFFTGNLIYRSIRDGGGTWRLAFDSAVVALITIGLIAAFEALRKRKGS